MPEPYTPAELEAGAEALRTMPGRHTGPWELHATAVLAAVLPDHHARTTEPYRRRIAALEDLLGCYRTGRQPSERLHRRLEATRAALVHVTTPTTEEDPDAR